MIPTDQMYAREKEIFEVIKELPEKAVVVGGYAVNAYSPQPRTSVDLDVVISESQHGTITKLLRFKGYKRHKFWSSKDKIYSGKAERYVKEIEGLQVSVDLMINSLSHRETNAEWSYKLILKDSKKLRIFCTTGQADALVPSREMLIAMKLHSFRNPDKRDIGMLIFSDKVDIEKLLELANRGETEYLKSNIKRLISEVQLEAYMNSFKGVFSYGRPFDIEKFKKKVLHVLKELDVGLTRF